MASAQEKGVKYIYNMNAGGNIKHDSDSSANSNTKKVSSRGGWGLRRSKTIREVDHRQYGEVNAGEAKKGMVLVGRKSVSGGGSGGEARKSVSYLEVNAASVAAYLQAKVLVTDMPAFMQVHAFRCARRTFDNLDTFSSKQLACSLKKGTPETLLPEFDKVYGPAWHCIVGSSFGSFVTHSTGCFLYFTMEKQYILVFKTKVQMALKS